MGGILKPTSLTTVGSWNVAGELSRFSYRNGYLNAANLLADAIESSEGFDTRVQSVIYPTLHLYRHFVELKLKDYIDLAVFVGPYLPDLYEADQVKVKRDKLGHDLQKTYDLLKQVICQVYDGNRDTAKKSADERCLALIEWFHYSDKRGDSFRYTLNLRAKAQFEKPFSVDIIWLRSRVSIFASYIHEERQILRSLLDPEADDMMDRVYRW